MILVFLGVVTGNRFRPIVDSDLLFGGISVVECSLGSTINTMVLGGLA